MKVSELLEAEMPKTPPEYKEEWDTAITKKIRDIARDCQLTATISGGALQKNKKFVGKSFSISLKERGASKNTQYRATQQHAKEAPWYYETFWKEIYEAFHEKYEMTAPINHSKAAKEFTAKTYSGPYGKFFMHMKGVQNIDQKKTEKSLISQINQAVDSRDTALRTLSYSPDAKDASEKRFRETLYKIKKELELERSKGRTYPEVEKLLDPDSWPDIARKAKLARHSTALRTAMKVKDKSPYGIQSAITAIKHARAMGHPLPELEKILPSKDYSETIRSTWEKYLMNNMIHAIEQSNERSLNFVMTEINRLEAQEGHKFPELRKLLDGEEMPQKFWQIATKKEHPSDEDIVKYILTKYKDSSRMSGGIGGLNPTVQQVKTLMDLARKAGHDPEEFKAIQRSVDHAS